MVSFTLFTLLPLISGGVLTPGDTAARLVIAAINLGVLVDLQRRGERLLHTLVLAVPVAFPAFGLIEARPGDVTGALTLAAFALSASQVLTVRAFAFCVPLVAVPHVLAGLVGQQSAKVVDDSLVAVGMSFAAAVFVDALSSGAARAATLDAAVAQEQARLAADQAQVRAIAAAGRVLHDEVLVTLGVVAEDRADPERLRALCARAVNAVRDFATARDDLTVEGDEGPRPPLETGDASSSALRRIVTASPVPVEVTGSAQLGNRLSSSQLASVERAVGEALRNVARHSGATRAELRIRSSGRETILDVVDHGVGLPEDHRAGYGTQHSIMAAVQQVGGRASSLPTPGGGTTLRLAFSAHRGGVTDTLRESYELAMRPIADTQMIRSIAWPIALVWISIATRNSFAWPDPGASLLLAAAYLVMTVRVIRRLEAGPLTPRSLVAFGLGLMALNAAGLALAPDQALLDYRSWFVGWIALPVVLLVFVLPLWTGLLLVASQTALVVVASQVDPALSGGVVPWSSLNATLSSPLVAVLMGHLLRRTGRTIRKEEADLARAAQDRARLRSTQDVASTHLAHTRRVVVPWLESVASGTLALPADRAGESTAERARLFALEVRDDLYAPSFFDDALRRRVTDFRSSGGVVEVRTGFDSDGDLRRIRGLVDHLLDVVDHQHTVIVAPPRGSEGPRMIVTPPVDVPPLAGVHVDRDEFRTVLRL